MSAQALSARNLPLADTATIPLRLTVALVLAHVAFSGNRFIFTLQSVALGGTPLQTGLLLGVLMLGPTLLSVHFGRWADRVGYKQPAATGYAVLLLADLLAAAAGGLPLLFAAALLAGTGYMLLHIVLVNLIGTLSAPGNVTRAFSILALGTSLSALAGPLFSGFLIDASGHAAAYLLMAGSCAAGGAVLWVVSRRQPAVTSPAKAQRDGRSFDLLQDKTLRLAFIMSGLLSMAWDMFMFAAPLHGVAIGLSASATGAVVAAFAAGAFAVRLAIPALTRRVTEWQIATGVIFISAGGFVVFPLLDLAWALGLASFLLGTCLGCAHPISLSLVHQAAPPHRAGEAVGIRAAITSLTQSALPVLFGMLGSAIGVVAVFWAASLLLAGGGAAASRR